MAEAILSQISGEFLECTICLEPYKDPKVLPCLHTFCEGCLKKFVAQQGDTKDKFPCPTCRADTLLPEGGVAGLKNNFFVLSLSDTVHAHKSLVRKDDKVPCDSCEEEEEVAIYGCVVCEEFLCDECACSHHRAKRTRSHDVVRAAELKEQLIIKARLPKSKSLPVCPKHQDEKMKFYCETCKHPICRDCCVLQHKDHKYGYLADTVGNVRAEIQEKLEAARQKMAEFQDKASTVARKQADLDTRSKKAAYEIDAAAEEEMKHFCGLVKNKQTELKEKLAAITATRSKQLAATADRVESILGCLSRTVDFSQKVTEHGSDFDVMNVCSDITKSLEYLLKCPNPDISDNISYVMFDPKKGRKEKGVILGNVVDEELPEEMLEEGEELQAEATFRFTLENFSKCKKDQVSPAVFIRNLPWKIAAEPYYDPDSHSKTLAVFLQCDADSKSLWSCPAWFELRLIPQMKGVQMLKREFQHVFYSKENCWGCYEFVPWLEACDPRKGYIKDDKIVLEAYVKAEAPRGEKELIHGNWDVEGTQEKEMEKDKELQTEATFRFIVENVSEIMGNKLSPIFLFQNLPWRLFAKPQYVANTWHLGVYLQCDAVSNSLWSCSTSVELRLIPQRKGVQMFKREFDHIFYSNESDWGFPDFMPWHKVCDPQKGYIKDNKIVLEAYVEADVPVGMKEVILGNIFSEETEDKEESGAEAIIRLSVENVSTVEKRQYSNPVFLCNLPWKMTAEFCNNKFLGVNLQCDADSDSLWSCCASVELRLIPQVEGVQKYTRKYQHVFHNVQSYKGYRKFVPWDVVCDPQNGYIKNDTIMLEAYVKANAPRITA